MSKEIVNLVRQAGVVGAGGAGFPTHVKISAKAETVIVNGAECEPLLRVDQQLMAVQAENLVKGLEAVMSATGASTGIIALKAKYKKAIEALTEVIEDKPIKLFLLGDFFPAGDEQVLVYEVTGRVVPPGGIPLKVGCVVSNVETVINVANALDGVPVTDTWVTVTGEVPRPITLKLPVGTPVAEVLALAGVSDLQDIAVIDGGPMMGGILENFLSPITKATKGLIVLPAEHPLVINKTAAMEYIIRRAKSTCIQCAMCTDVCPRGLLGHKLQPHKIMRSLNYAQSDETLKMALLCCECGVCGLYGCPMMLSPRKVNAALKKELGKQGIRLDSASDTLTNSPVVSHVRDYRKVPVKRLVSRLGLSPYDRPAPLSEDTYRSKNVYIPLRQHIGAPCIPVVEASQRVEKGTLIAAVPEGALGASIHASISGTVIRIGDHIEIESCGKRGDGC
jgi:RnfABCDGE-type electron transport complex C subunit